MTEVAMSQLDMSLLAFEDHMDFDSGLGPKATKLWKDTDYSIVVDFGECAMPGCLRETCCHYCMCGRDEHNLGKMKGQENLIRQVCERAAEEVTTHKHRANMWCFLAYSFAFVSLVLYLSLVFLWRDSQGLLLTILTGVCLLNAGFMSGARAYRAHAGLCAQESLANYLHGQKFQLLDYGIQPRPGYLADYIQFKFLG